MTFHPERYPPDWKSVSRRIRERDGQKCTVCGVANGAVGARDRFGAWHDETSIDHMNSTEGFHLWPDGYPKTIQIVLTVAHRDGVDPMDVRDEVLFSACQKCHLAYDRERNAVKSRHTRRTKRGMQTEMAFLPAPRSQYAVRDAGAPGGAADVGRGSG